MYTFFVYVHLMGNGSFLRLKVRKILIISDHLIHMRLIDQNVKKNCCKSDQHSNDRGWRIEGRGKKDSFLDW